MQAGKLNKRIKLIRNVKRTDSYGGWLSNEEVVTTFWAEKKDIDGVFEMTNGKRRHYTESEFIIRKKTLSDFKNDDLFEVEGESRRYRFNSKYEIVNDFYVKIKATKTDF